MSFGLDSSTTESRGLGKVLPLLAAVAVLLLAALLGRWASGTYLLLAGGAVAFLLLLRQPGLGLVVVAVLSFTLPFEIGTGSEVSLTPPVLLIPAVVLAWLLDGLRRGEVRLPASRTVLPLLLFLATGLLSLLAGRGYWDPLVPQPGNLLLVQLGQWAIFALSAAVYLVAGDLGARGGLLSGRTGGWLRIATFAFLAVASIVVLEFYVPPLRRLLGWSHQSMANRSMFWVWLPALAAGQLLFNRRLTAWAKLWLLALLSGAAYVVWFQLADWVSGWVPFTVSAVAVAWFWVWRRNRALALVVAMALLVLAMVLYPTLFLHAGGEREFRVSWGGRIALYEATLDLVKDHPILGLGPAAYRHYGLTRWLYMGMGQALYLQPRISSHNNYIDVYAQMGLVGLGLFLWFLIEVGLLGWRLGPRFEEDSDRGFENGYVHGALGGLAGTLVAMMLADWFLPFVYNIGFTGFRTSALAWMFLGGLVALEQVSRNRQPAAGE
jgi:O-antigen ligase